MTKRFPTDPGRSNACIRTPGSLGYRGGIRRVALTDLAVRRTKAGLERVVEREEE